MLSSLRSCFSRSESRSHDDDHLVTAPLNTALQRKMHARIDEIERTYKKFPAGFHPFYRQRAEVVREAATTLMLGAPSSEVDAKLRCHAQEMKSLLMGPPPAESNLESNMFGARRKPPGNAVDLQLAFIQLEGVWACRLPPASEAQAQLYSGIGMKVEDPDSLFQMRPIYEGLVSQYEQDCRRMGKGPSWIA